MTALPNLRYDIDHIVEPSRRQVINRTAPHGEDDAIPLLQNGLVDTRFAQHFGTPSLKVPQVICVIDNACEVDILIIDTDAPAMA